MKNTLNTSEAASILMSDDNAAWSKAGAYALIEHLEQIEEDYGTEIELDRIELRGSFSEYTDLLDWAYGYWGTGEWKDELGFNVDEEIDEDEAEEAISIYIQDHGVLIEFDGGIIVSEF